MKQTRTLFEVINFLLAVLLVIPLGVFVEQVCGHSLFTCCMVPCVAVIGHIIGRFSLKSPINLAMAMTAVALAAALVLSLVLSWGLGLATVLITVVSTFFSVFFFFTARKAAYTIYAPMSVTGISIHLVILLCCTGFEWGEKVGSFTSAIAIAFFLLSLFAFSSNGLRRSMHRGSADKRVTYPAGMQMGNFLLVCGFILIAGFISNIYPIFQLFSQGFSVVLKALLAILAFIGSLFDRRTISQQPIDEGGTEVAASDNIMNYEAKGEASWVTTAVEIFAFICVMLFVLYAIYKIIKKMQEAGVRLPGFMRNIRDKFAPVVEEDYVDESESLFDMKKMLADTRESMKKALQKLRERPQKLDDFKDNKMKVRFAFQQMLKKVKTRDPRAISKTPNEIYRAEYDGEEEFREFLDYYNQAKYSDDELPDDAGECARAILKQKL